MNWLTARFAEIETFRDLYGNAFQFSGSPIRQLPLKDLQNTLRGYGFATDFSGVQEQADGTFLYIEDSNSAELRMQRAGENYRNARSARDEPFQFTTAMDDGSGFVLYLPDEDTDDQDVQLFSSEQSGRTTRLQFSGNLTPASADLVRASVSVPDVCADGPCPEWGEECGGSGCLCQKFPDVADRVSSRLSRAINPLRARRVAVSVLKCHREE